MPFRPALTAEDLHNMRVRNTHSDGTIDPDQLAALWEIKRLRSLLLRLDQVSCDLRRPSGLMGDIYDELMQQIAVEPCVIERKEWTAEILEAPYKLPKGMARR